MSEGGESRVKIGGQLRVTLPMEDVRLGSAPLVIIGWYCIFFFFYIFYESEE